MRSFLNITQALADETRLRIILALSHQELCVCQIISLLELAPSTISTHLSLLAKAGIVEKRKLGKWAYYRLATEDGTPVVKTALSWVCKALGGTGKVKKDLSRLKKLLLKSVDETCLETKTRYRLGRE